MYQLSKVEKRDLYSLIRGLIMAPTIRKYNAIMASINEHLSGDPKYANFLVYFDDKWLKCNWAWNLTMVKESTHSFYQFTNNISERAFRTLKETVAKKRTKFTNEEFIETLTTHTQLFFERREHDKLFTRDTVIFYPKRMVQDGDDEEEEDDDEENEEEVREKNMPKLFISPGEKILIDNFEVDPSNSTCSCRKERCLHLTSFFEGF